MQVSLIPKPRTFSIKLNSWEYHRIKDYIKYKKEMSLFLTKDQICQDIFLSVINSDTLFFEYLEKK